MAQDLNAVIAHLQNQIDGLNNRQQLQAQALLPLPVEEHRDLEFNITRAEDVSLNLLKPYQNSREKEVHTQLGEKL